MWELAELKTGSHPEPRSGHTFTNVGSKNILFGGFGRKNGKPALLTLRRGEGITPVIASR